MACWLISDKEIVRAFILEEDNFRHGVQFKGWLRLTLCFGLDVFDHLLVPQRLHIPGYVEALIDGQLKPFHPSSA